MNENYCKNFAEKNKKLLAILISALSVFLAVLIVGEIVKTINVVKSSRYIGPGNVIIFSASAEIYVKPDLVLIDFSAITEAKNVAEALSKNAEKTNNIINYLKEQGIESKDIKTTSFNIYPRYEYNKVSDIFPSGKRVLVGYEVQQTLQVKIRDLNKIGVIIEGVVEKGANEVGSLQFTIDKEEEIRKQVREEAIKKTKDKAKELASQLGIKLGRIINFNENSVMPRFYGLEKAAMGAGGGTPQIESGENKIEVTVNITYEIN